MAVVCNLIKMGRWYELMDDVMLMIHPENWVGIPREACERVCI